MMLRLILIMVIELNLMTCRKTKDFKGEIYMKDSYVGNETMFKEVLYLKPEGNVWKISGYECWVRSCLRMCSSLKDDICSKKCRCRNPDVFRHIIYTKCNRDTHRWMQHG